VVGRGGGADGAEGGVCGHGRDYSAKRSSGIAG
jgi:hypothetical protein